MQYKYIHSSCFDEIIDDMEKRISNHYREKPYWRTARRIAFELGFKHPSQRETRAIGAALRKIQTPTRIIRGYVQFWV